ncbi:sensor histidine kinase [Paenibacillus sp. GCM10012306]|uniref:sensor histidine kinase n=1 Tax=Paenibacillus sp. GCM10012306 TaxID=3317342 RepID=UPI00361BBF5A
MIVLGAAACLFAILYSLQVSQTRRLMQKLRQLNDEERSQLVTMSFPSKLNQELVIEINRLIGAKEQMARSYQWNEKQLHQRISNISHDMRTPLTAILGYLHMLIQNKATDQEKSHYLRIVEKRARALHRLIWDFYDLSRLDEGEYALESTLIDVNEIGLNLLAEVYDDFESSGFQVDVSLPPAAPKVIADANAVHRVIENVLQNAKKHGKNKLRVDSKVESGSIVMSFANESEFITKQELSHVFDRSYTTSSSRTNDSTGLGLSICQSLLTQMGHNITADYTDGIFIITIIWNIESEEYNNDEAKSK